MCINDEMIDLLGNMVLFCLLGYEGDQVLVEQEIDGKIEKKTLQFCIRYGLMGLMKRILNPLRMLLPSIGKYSLNSSERLVVSNLNKVKDSLRKIVRERIRNKE